MHWQGVDIIATGERAKAELKARKAISRVNVDATGVDAGVAPYIQRQGIAAHSVKVASSPKCKNENGEFQILRDQLWWQVREWLRSDPGAMLPPDEMLAEELAVPTYEVSGGKMAAERPIHYCEFEKTLRITFLIFSPESDLHR